MEDRKTYDDDWRTRLAVSRRAVVEIRSAHPYAGNLNLVVNGDAEMVHVLDFLGQCYVKQKGSLQKDAMREEICRVMEGGREAFERRYRRLGSEPTHVR